MLKNISNLDGVQKLNKREQQSISGGKRPCGPHCPCPTDQVCVGGICWFGI